MRTHRALARLSALTSPRPADPAPGAAGIMDLRVQSTFAPRSAAHATLGVHMVLRTRKLRWLAVTGVAIASDVAMRAWLRDDRRWRVGARVAWDTADAAFWGWFTRHDPSDGLPRQIMLADVVPHAVEAGVRLASGTEARPVLDGAVPLPLRSPTDVVRVAVKGLSVALLPSLTVRAIRRGWGDPHWAATETIWPFSALLLSTPLSRTRHRLQKRAVHEWESRAETTAARQSGDLRLALASHPSIGHDFPKVLQVLGYFGSHAARQAGLEGLARPAQLAPDGRGSGRLLGQLVNRSDLEPEDAALHWLDGPEVDAVRSFLDRPRAEAATGPLRVTRTGDGSVVLALGGEDLELRPPLEGVRGNLDPIEGVLVVSVFWKLVVLLPAFGGRRGNRLSPVVAAALDVAAAVEHRRTSADGIRPNRRSLALATAGLVLMAGREARDEIPRWTSSGAPIVSTTMSACGALGLLGTWWDDLGPERWAWLGVTMAGFGLGATRAGRRRDPVLCWEVVPLWQVFGAVRGLTRVVVSEREVLAAHLSERYRDRLVADGARYLTGQLDEYRDLLVVAREAIADHGAEMPAEVTAEVESRCDALERWLDAPATGAELAGLAARTLGIPGAELRRTTERTGAR